MATLLTEFKEFYSDFGTIDARAFSRIYGDNIIFRDPVHEIRGADNLCAYLEKLGTNLASCRFEYLDELTGDHSAYIRWNMVYRHPRLGDRIHTLRGMSQIQFEDQIIYHEDVYDLGAMVYEHLPLMGGLTRMVKKRLAG